jgi:hypothetical protein
VTTLRACVRYAQASVEQGLVAVNTCVFNHWMGIFSQAEMSAFVAEYQFVGATVSDEKQAEIMEDGPPENEGPWVVIGRVGTFHQVILQSKHQSMTAGSNDPRVTKLTPGSGNPAPRPPR